MPSQTSAVGALTLPVPAGVAQAQFEDPVVEALLDFLAWSLNNDLNNKLANLTGTSSVAVPDGTPSTEPDNRHSYNPFEPRAPHARLRVPALFVWWDGNSTTWRPSQCQWGLERFINALYVFQELPLPAELERRSGLFNAVGACFAKAAERGRHPSYSYNSKPNGTPLEESIGDFCMWEWEYVGGKGLQRIGIDDPNTRLVGPRKAGRHYPAFAAMFKVRELVAPVTMQDPGDVAHDSPITIYNAGVEILDRTLEAPDGDGAQP